MWCVSIELEGLSHYDRVAFACRFLDDTELQSFLTATEAVRSACPHGLPRRYCRHTRCLPAYGLRREIMGLLMISTDRDFPAFPHFPGPVISPRIRTLTLVWLLGLHTRRHCGGERCAGCCCAGCHHQRTSLPRQAPTATDGVALRAPVCAGYRCCRHFWIERETCRPSRCSFRM